MTGLAVPAALAIVFLTVRRIRRHHDDGHGEG
jgi:uncharacterized membrane-anchored protein